MPVLRAQRWRVSSAQITSCGGLFGDDEEIVAARVGLGEMESIFLRIAEIEECVDGGFGEEPSAQALMLLSWLR